MKEAQFEVF